MARPCPSSPSLSSSSLRSCTRAGTSSPRRRAAMRASPSFSALFLVVLWAPLGAWAALGEMGRWGWREWLVLFGSAIVHVLYFTTLLRGYRLSDLTVVYPVARGTGPLLATVGALLWFGESLSVVAGAGVAGIAVGVFFIAGGPGLWAKSHDPGATQPRARGHRLGRRDRRPHRRLHAARQLCGQDAADLADPGRLCRQPVPRPLPDAGGAAPARRPGATCGVPSGDPHWSSRCSGRSATCSCSMPCGWRP